MLRRICVFTGSRAEYGLLMPLMNEIKRDKGLKLQIIASGTHLSGEFGLTYKEIEKDRFFIDERIKIPLATDAPEGLGRAIGMGLGRLIKGIGRLKPHIIVILGDRFEAFAAAMAAMVSRVPIVHINGGEATFGLLDEAMRHSITKMSHLHFTANERYRRRVIQLGEEPRRVFNVGALNIDNIKKLRLLSRETIEKELRFKFNKRNLLITFHPVTLEEDTAECQLKNLLCVLDELKDTHLIFTKANADPQGRRINRLIDEYVAKNQHKATAFVSLGQLKYLSLMQYVDAVLGNSSSGIIEAPSFKIGTINIGDRQEGRIGAESIIDCKPTKEGIKKAFEKLHSKEFQKNLKKLKNPYGDGNSAKRIKNILKNYHIQNILKKTFYDLNF